jgi:hypothetical protein
MEIRCTDSRTFELIENGRKLGNLGYSGHFTFKALLSAEDKVYELSPEGIFSTSVAVKYQSADIASLKMNWKGNIVISFVTGEEYILKAVGALANKYVLEDGEGRKLMMLLPEFNWRKMLYNYTITYDQRPENLLLVLLAVYSANYYIASVMVMM